MFEFSLPAHVCHYKADAELQPLSVGGGEDFTAALNLKHDYGGMTFIDRD